MSVLPPAIVTVLTIVALACIASERMRAYGLQSRLVDVRAIAIAVSVTVTRIWLATRGIGGIDTSLVFGLAAVAAITDLQCGYVFDRVSIAGSAAVFAAAAARGNVATTMAGGVIGALLLAIPWAVSRARGMGLGDVKLAGVLGCGLGPLDAIRAVWFAFAIGAVVAIACIVTGRRSRGEALPLAPFLALGTVLSAGGIAW